MHSSFLLENITPPVFDEGYEIVPAGYVIFSSLLEYKKMKNLDNLIRNFLKRLPGIKNDDDKVFKCLDKIESIVDKCGKLILSTNFEETFDVAFPGIVRFIKKVGFGYGEKNNKLYDAGINIRFDDNMSGKVKHKYCVILHKLYEQNIWPFEIFM